jgi:hypothetical protein
MAVWLLAAPGKATAQAGDGWVDTFDNAAVDYWRARAVMQAPAEPADFALLTFASELLPIMEPRVLALNPDAARWLLRDRPMLGHLRDAAGRTFCYFHPPGPGRGPGDLTHHKIVAELASRALAVASALEFVENEEAAGQAYADVLRMLDRLDEDLEWASAYRRLSLLPETVSAVEGFCSREPPRQALTAVTDYLAGLDRPCFPQQAYLEKEKQTYRSWLLKDRNQARERLAALYGQAALQPAIDKLSTLSAADRSERLEAWFTEYEREMSNLATLVQEPYDKALRGIENLDKRVARLADDPSAEGVNPLLPLLLRPFAQTYQQFLAGEAIHTMLDIAVAATVQRDFTGSWPDRLEQIESFVGRSFPVDPFTGKPHRYDLRGGQAYVSTKAPSWLRRQTNMALEIALDDRRERDAKNLDKQVKVFNAERLRATMEAQAAEAAKKKK